MCLTQQAGSVKVHMLSGLSVQRYHIDHGEVYIPDVRHNDLLARVQNLIANRDYEALVGIIAPVIDALTYNINNHHILGSVDSFILEQISAALVVADQATRQRYQWIIDFNNATGGGLVDTDTVSLDEFQAGVRAYRTRQSVIRHERDRSAQQEAWSHSGAASAQQALHA